MSEPETSEPAMSQGAQPRRSPPAARVVAVLDFLARRPSERFGLSELARLVGLSKPTCLGILNELTAAGYLMRDGVARYGLGPALIAAGQAASQGYALGALARQHLEPLSAEFGAVCTASAVAGDKIVMLESVGPKGLESQGVGRVYPFAPPVGLMYVLWEPDVVFERWLDLEPALPVRLDRDHLRRVVTQCREAGYLVESLTPIGQRLHRLMAGVEVDELPAEVRELVGEMVSSLGERVYLDSGAEGSHPVNVIAAPTFDGGGRQSMVLTLHVGAEISAAEIRRRGESLAAAAAAVTTEAGGRIS